ncbi:MAG: hypothetical protein ACRCR9_03995 [Chitinophagaceae bacterium]
MIPFKTNQTFVGILVGSLLPMLSFWAFYQIRVRPTGISYDMFLLALRTESPVLYNPVTFIVLLVNGVLFAILINFKKYKFAFGLFYITLVYGLISIILKWYFFGNIF